MTWRMVRSAALSSMVARWATTFVVVAVVGVGATGCRTSERNAAAIRIVSPENGSTLSIEDDQDTARDGVQVAVNAEIDGIGTFAALALLIDNTQVAVNAATIDGNVVFAGVTLPPGAHELSVRTVNGGVQSNASRYTLSSLVITDPANNTTLTGSDDEDPVANDTQHSVTVQAFGIELSQPITLRIDGADVDTMNAGASGSVVFARQTFTPGTHTLQAVAGEIASPVAMLLVTDLCPRVDLVSPDLGNGTDPFVLGPQYDTLGPRCGDEFAIDVVAATNAADGSVVTLLVNGTARATTTVLGTVARFSAVVLGNRGVVANRLSFEVQYEGATCRSEVARDVLVDCVGVSCNISSPAQTTFLSASLDRSLQPGFQGDFEVTTDLSALGQPVTLIIDGNALDLRTAAPIARGAIAVAMFSASLDEGEHSLLAVCTDATGNVTTSGQAMWTVDTIACGVNVTSPRSGAFVLETDDVDMADGIQVDVMADVVGSDCERSRAAICGGLSTQPLLPISGNTAIARVTLSTATMQNICVEVHDRAGNISLTQTPVFYDSDAPLLSIRAPQPGTHFNMLGNDIGGVNYRADLFPLTPACDVAFEVQCSDLETDVLLYEHVSGQPIPNAVAPCDPASSPTPTYPGVARFTSVSLPRLGTVAVHARQTAAGGRLVGISAPITLFEDCQAPTLTISSGNDTLCGAELGPSLDAPGSGTTSITRDITVSSDDPVAISRVRLRVVPVGGGAPIADITDSETPFLFDNVNFSAFGEHDVVIDARDQSGNAAIAPSCRVSVVDAPAMTLVIREGNDGDETIEAEDDCSNAPGLQIAISGTTNAPAGTATSITVGNVTHFTSVMCAGSNCTFSVCVDAPQGNVTVRARINDPAKPTAGVIERQIVIDSLPPMNAITDLRTDTPMPDATRDSHVTFRWTDVADQGGIPLMRYDLRCANTAITDEMSWSNAAALAVDVMPGNAGGQRSITIDGFTLYSTHHCVLRGLDAGDALTPITDSTNATVDFLALRERDVIGAATEELGRSLAAIGDINHDGIDDFIAGGVGLARVFLGAVDLTTPLRTITIQGGSDSFGARVAGLGDINGDGIDDFAVAEPEAAAVAIFLGRDERVTSNTRWPNELDALTDTSIAFRSANDDLFGAAVASAGDINGDGFNDFAIGAPDASNGAGRVHVVLGQPLCSVDRDAHCLLLGSTTTLGDGGGNIDGFVLSAVDAAQFGRSIVALGDVNGDLMADLAFGAPGSIDDAIDATLYLWPGAAYDESESGIIAIDDNDLVRVQLGAAETAGHVIAVLRNNATTQLAITFDNAVAVIELNDPFGAVSLDDEARVLNDLGTASDRFGDSIANAFVPGLPSVNCDLDLDGADELFVGFAGRGGAPGGSELFYRSTLWSARDNTNQLQRSDANVSSRAALGSRVVACIGDINRDGQIDLLTADPTDAQGAGTLTILY